MVADAREDARPRALAIAGPTASGKTAFALACAMRFGGEIVSVDSALVYRALDIGAAKPTPGERSAVPHHLVDIRDPWDAYSAADFARDARAAVAEPRNGIENIGGPNKMTFEQMARDFLARRHDGIKTIVVDPAGRYFGAALGRDSLDTPD